MRKVPKEFRKEFEEKGETFFEIAGLLYTHPDRQYTQGELADKVDKSNETISDHTTTMEDKGWVTRQDNQTTFSWNTEAHNPASTEGITAAKQFYVDCWVLIKKHSQTLPGVLAMIGFGFVLTAAVVFAFFLGISSDAIQSSNISTVVYLAIAIGSFTTGVILTALSPLQALVNRIVLQVLPESLFNR
jgi:hypothetical protein